MTDALVRALLASQNPDGGWGPATGQSSTTELTALATLALGLVDRPVVRARASHGLRWLVERQHPDGGWPVSTRVSDGSWSTALAVLALDVLGHDTSSAVRGGRWLMRRSPREPGLLTHVLYRVAPGALPVRLNPDLKGWAWTSEASSFVEPTSYALLALKRLRHRMPERAVIDRIEEGERLVYDRMCHGGGWNYGNSTVLDVALWPYADVTALALLALRDRGEREANRRSLHALRGMLEHVSSGLSLAWATLCFAAYGEDPEPWRRRLLDRYGRTAFLDERRAVALAVLAVTGGAEVFRT
jgi:hypothetical protein